MRTKELNKTLSRKLHETRGNVTNCGMIYYYIYDQFNRYQQNEHSSFTIAELPEHNNKQTTAYHVENPGPELGEVIFPYRFG
jgi:hypothetical protein